MASIVMFAVAMSAVLAVSATALGAPLAASAPSGADARFECAAKPADTASPPPAPTFRTQAAARVATAQALLAKRALCADGQVPVLTSKAAADAAADLARRQKAPDPGPIPGAGARSASVTRERRQSITKLRHSRRPRRLARARAKLARENHSPYGWYSYAIGSQDVPWQDGTFSLYGWQSNEAPFIMYNQPCEHSNSQLWGRDNTFGPAAYSGEEIGWMVDQCRFGYQDLAPHLQVELHDYGYVRCEEQTCWGVPAGSGWHPYTNVIQPGAVLTHNDTWHTYGVHQYLGNWWYYYDGYWLGYYDPGAFQIYQNYGFTEIQAGGEVFSEYPYYNTCSDMGSYGPIWGHQGNAAMWLGVWRGLGQTSQWANFTPYMSDPAQYDTGYWYGGYQFRYGGNGWC